MCRGLLPRFWFNGDTKECETFNWGGKLKTCNFLTSFNTKFFDKQGCGGNANNFASLEECQKECVV